MYYIKSSVLLLGTMEAKDRQTIVLF